jgi:hypothetical protein
MQQPRSLQSNPFINQKKTDNRLSVFFASDLKAKSVLNTQAHVVEHEGPFVGLLGNDH